MQPAHPHPVAAVLLALGALASSACGTLNALHDAPSSLAADCATAAVVGLHWTAPPHAQAPPRYRILRDGRSIGTTAADSFADASVAASATYLYEVGALDGFGRIGASATLRVSTAAPSGTGDAPYCPSALIGRMSWDWRHGVRAAEGSDLWSVTWGQDGDSYAFFGDGGGFGGDDFRGRTSFGIARMSGPPPPAGAAGVNIYGGYLAQYPSRLSGKARSIIAIGADFYAIAGIYRGTDRPARDAQPISGSPAHVEIAYSLGDAHSWQEVQWTFCDTDSPSRRLRDAFCPLGFINDGPGNSGAADRYVYLFGTSARADRRAARAPPAARTYLARVDREGLLSLGEYRYFGGFDSHSQPIWTASADRMQPIFLDRNARSSTLEEAVYDAGLARYIGVAQGDKLAQTSFYDAPHPWGPWTTIAYHNVDASNGGGGWGNLGSEAGESLGVHCINAWTSRDGLTLWMAFSSDGRAPPGALFPLPGAKLDALHLVRAELQLQRHASD